MLKISKAFHFHNRYVIRNAISNFFNRETGSDKALGTKSTKKIRQIRNAFLKFFGREKEDGCITKRKDQYVGCKAPSQLYCRRSEHYYKFW